MNLSFFIARRYLVARKSTNAIHILSGLSILGMSIGALALILVMAVFNGFENLVFSLTNKFNPDIEIAPREGKTFRQDSLLLIKLQDLEGVEAVSLVLEENALFAYREVQDIGVIKGVDEHYVEVSEVRDRMLDGSFSLATDLASQAVVGAGIAGKLGLDMAQHFEPLILFMPNRKRSGPLDQPFIRRSLEPAGVFSIQPDIDMEYVLTNLAFVQSITGQRGSLSAIEIALNDEANPRTIIGDVEDIVGSEYIVRDRIMQEATFLRVMNMEKWVAFAIMCLIMLLVAFNVAGTLWMVVTEKRDDIAILKTMGATSQFVQRVFILNGLLLCGAAFVFGAIGAILFYILQSNFGLIPVPPGFIIDAYPMELRAQDFVVVFVTVMAIGALAAWLPARRAALVDAVIKQE